MNTEKIIFNKKHLKENLDKLSESDIQEILDFAEFILTKRYKRKQFPQKRKLDPQKDPILKLIGIADVEPFAHKIDRELYS